jgi:hypothetical protein
VDRRIRIGAVHQQIHEFAVGQEPIRNLEAACIDMSDHVAREGAVEASIGPSPAVLAVQIQQHDMRLRHQFDSPAGPGC